MPDSADWIVTPNLGHELVTLEVGTGESMQKFSVHKKLLCQISPTFLAGFSGRFREAETNEIALPDDDPDAFGLLVNWLYSGNVPIPPSPLSQRPGNRVESIDLTTEGQERVIKYHRLLVLADKYIMLQLQQKAYEEIRKILGESAMPSLKVLEVLCSIDVANPRFKFYVAQVCAYWIKNGTIYYSSFEDFLGRQPEFAAYLSRAIVWRARLEKMEKLKHLMKQHPKYVAAFDKLAVEKKDEDKGRKENEFQVAEWLCGKHPEVSKGKKRRLND